MEVEQWLNYLFIIIGLLSLLAAFLNWDWVFQRQKKAGFIKLLDRNGARVFNFLLGFLLLLVGIFDFIFPLIP